MVEAFDGLGFQEREGGRRLAWPGLVLRLRQTTGECYDAACNEHCNEVDVRANSL